MPSPVVVKVASGLGAVGVIGGSVALYKSDVFKTKTTLGELVQKDKWTLLTSTNTEHISKILEAYKKTDTPKPTLLFDGFIGTEANASEKLLEECQKVSNKLSDDSNKDTLLKQIKKWCVVPKTVQERLEDFNISPLSTEEPTQPPTESQSWINKIGGYENNNSKFSELTTLTGGDNNAKAKVLRTRCKTELNIQSFTESFENTVDKVKLWCV